MLIRDMINRHVATISATEAKIREINKLRESLRAKKEFCGKCDKGIVYRPWPMIISDSWGVDFAKMMRELMPNGHPDDCECIGGGIHSEKLSRLEDEIQHTRDVIETWRARREALAVKVGGLVVDNGLHNFSRQGNESEIVKLESWTREHMRHNLIIVGESGSGKSHLACGIANQLCCDERNFEYIDGFAIDRFNNVDSFSTEARDRSVNHLSSVDYLIIDDAGKSKMTSALFAHVWFPIMKSRTDNGLTTIFTFDKIVRETWQASGVDLDQLNALYNRIESTVRSTPYAVMVFLDRINAKSCGTSPEERARERADIYG